MIRDSLLISLLSLIDDPDKTVREAVWSKLKEMGEDAVAEMETLIPQLSERINQDFFNSFIKELKLEHTLKKIKNYLLNPDPLLLDGLLLVTSAIRPDTDKVKYITIIQDIADDMLTEISDKRTAVENLEIFNYIFYKRVGFKHVDESVTKVDNAIITDVLETKMGNIFTIPLCYFLLARYTGLPVYPVIVGRSFTPAYLDNSDEILFFINIFKEGLIFSGDERDANISPRVGLDKALVSIYADHLNYLFKAAEDNERVEIMEKVLECFGNERYIN
jgi:regulator of sirC expression with transglutaminase-like and TPR domain